MNSTPEEAGLSPTSNPNEPTTRLAHVRSEIERMLAIAMADGMPDEFRSKRRLLEQLRDGLRKLPTADDDSVSRSEAEFLHHVQCDLLFRRLYTTSGRLQLLAILGKQIDGVQEASQLGGLSDDQLETYSQFFGLLAPLVAEVASNLREGATADSKSD